MGMIKNFFRNEDGAVTIDWVALTAGILLLGIAIVYGIFNEGVTPLYNSINSALSSASISATTGTAPAFNTGG